MPHAWQEINEHCLFCHWWQYHDRRMITAMNELLILLLIVTVTALSVETLRRVLHDGRGPQRPPASHFQDARFLPPSAR